MCYQSIEFGWSIVALIDHWHANRAKLDNRTILSHSRKFLHNNCRRRCQRSNSVFLMLHWKWRLLLDWALCCYASLCTSKVYCKSIMYDQEDPVLYCLSSRYQLVCLSSLRIDLVKVHYFFLVNNYSRPEFKRTAIVFEVYWSIYLFSLSLSSPFLTQGSK